MVDGEVVRSFSIQDILARYKQLRQCVDTKVVPDNDFELNFSDTKIEDFFSKGKVAKTKYESWKKGRLKKNEKIGDWQCNYCKYKEVCWGK